MKILFWLLRIIVAVILLLTVSFKFSAAPESVALFSKLGVEPWGRIASGVLEITAGLLILIPRTTAWGALLSAFIMINAMAAHIFVIGMESGGDGGQLFNLAIVVLVCSLLLLIRYSRQLGRGKKNKAVAKTSGDEL